jgi:hypothetical protein
MVLGADIALHMVTWGFSTMRVVDSGVGIIRLFRGSIPRGANPGLKNWRASCLEESRFLRRSGRSSSSSSKVIDVPWLLTFSETRL